MRTFAVVWPAQTRQRLDEFVLAVAGHARHADDLAGPHLKRHPVDEGLLARGGDRQSLDLDERPAWRGGGARDFLVDVAARHGAHDLRGRSFAGRKAGRHAPIAQHRHAVGDRHHFVELVRDKEDGASLFGEPAHDGEQSVALARRQNRRRLVENQNARAPIERLEDFDALPRSDRQLADDRVRVHLQTMSLREFVDLGARGSGVHKGSAPGLGAEDDVLPGRQRGKQPEGLVDHA